MDQSCADENKLINFDLIVNSLIVRNLLINYQNLKSDAHLPKKIVLFASLNSL